MCGRYRLTAKGRYLLDHFELDEDPSWTPRWNIAPTQLIPIVRQHGTAAKRSFDLVRWGLIPSWAKDRFIATKTINAMSETAADKPAFREALRLRRLSQRVFCKRQRRPKFAVIGNGNAHMLVGNHTPLSSTRITIA